MGHSAPLTQTNLVQSVPALTLVIGGKGAPSSKSLPRDIVILGVVLATLQILDGILTGVGMHLYGLEMEGNALLRFLMSIIGYVPALIFVKGASVALISILCKQSQLITWLKPTLYGVAALYIIGAVIPWTYILVSEIVA